LNEGELQADALADLTTKDNTLSVWMLENETLIERAATALSTNRDVLANFDYVVFDVHHLAALNIRVHESRGETPDEEVNAWHRDLIELSVQKIMGLAGVIQEHGRIERILEKRLAHLIAQGITAKNIDPDKLSQGIQAKVMKLLTNESPRA
jgi:hypothetical protein